MMRITPWHLQTSNKMKVKELIDALQILDPEMEIVVSDGYDCRFYSGAFQVQEFEGTADIGVGGTEILDQGKLPTKES